MSYYFKYNNTIISDSYIVTDIVKSALPKKIVDTIDIASRDGKLFNGCKYDSLEYKIELVIEGTDEFNYTILKQELIDILDIRYEVPISFTEGRTGFGQCTSELKIDDKSENKGIAEFTITCYEPHFYNDDIGLYENEEGAKSVMITNDGGLPVKPFVSVGFTQGAHFLQVENKNTEEKLLVGRYPKLELSSNKPVQYVLKDNCTDITTWIPSQATLAVGRGVGGTLSTSSISGGSFVLSTFPSDTVNKWKGASYRRNLNNGVDDVAVDNFEANIGFSFTSTGKNGDPENYKYKDAEETFIEKVERDGYQVTSSTLNVRTGAGTKYKKLGTIKKGYQIQTDWKLVNGWIKFRDEKWKKGVDLYCSTKYLKKIKWTDSVTTIARNYVTLFSAPIKSSPRLDAKTLIKIPAYTCIRCNTKLYKHTDADKKERWWMKLYTKYKGVMGYVCYGDVAQASQVNFVQDVEFVSADDLTGICEVYGMSPTGAQLFRVEVSDDTPWYEVNVPRVVVGGKQISSFTTTPAPKKQITNTTSAGSSSSSYEVNYIRGGTVGSWNDLNGEWYIKRYKNENGSYTWKIQLRKISKGNVIGTKTFDYTSKEQGADKLAYLVIYMGSTKTDLSKTSSMSINDIKIKSTDNLDATVDENVEYFGEGDILDIDFNNRKIYLNQTQANELLDIGSTFFDIEVGDTEVKFVSDDDNIVIGTTIREKWVGGE